MKKMMKIIILSVLIILLIATCSFAFSLGTVMGGGDSFMNSAIANASENSDVTTMIKGFSGAIMSIGVVVAIVTGLIIAIKIMTDSAVNKADVKSSLFPYAIGIIVLVGGYGIWKAIVNILQNI